jgi:UDP-N-acetylmuramyl pentapeptide phosphotransferase/UDP-N-acetylglucosamine-1-phosphate transferase
MLASSLFNQIQDHPNARSLHDRPVPRFGGLALMLGTLTAWQLIKCPLSHWLFPSIILLMLLSLLDDLKDLPAKWRLIGHFLVSIGFVELSLAPLPISLALVFTLGLVWMTNLYNFMDGSNGLAGGMAVIGFTFFALVAWMAGELNFALMNFSIVGSSIAFLVFNFGNAKTFMGDAGSIPLGFLAAAIGLLGWQNGLWPLWFPLVIFRILF